MVFFEKRTIEFADGRNNSRKLSQFMNQCLANRTYYNINFWDVGYSYEVGETPAEDWLGVRCLLYERLRQRRAVTPSQSEFNYNP